MRDLGDVLELLRTSPQRWDTLRLAGREWRHLARSHEAWERWVAALQGHSGGSSVMTFTAKRDQAEGEEPEESVERWRLWRAKPDRIRTQFQVSMETVTAVLIGSEWWSWTPSAGLRTNGGDPSSTHGVGPAEILVDTPESYYDVPVCLSGNGADIRRCQTPRRAAFGCVRRDDVAELNDDGDDDGLGGVHGDSQ